MALNYNYLLHTEDQNTCGLFCVMGKRVILTTYVSKVSITLHFSTIKIHCVGGNLTK